MGHAELLEQDEPLAFVVSDLVIKYLKPARIDDALAVRTTYDSARGPRLFISQRITRGEELVCQALVEAACIDLQGRPRKPPPGMLDTLRPLFA